jgi:hypothetical protein
MQSIFVQQKKRFKYGDGHDSLSEVVDNLLRIIRPKWARVEVSFGWAVLGAGEVVAHGLQSPARVCNIGKVG